MNYWLFKSEPDVYGLPDLEKQPKQTDHWDGVRNYQVRNMMRDDMAVGDLVLFYHSNCKPPGVAGVAKIVKEAYPDHTAFDPKSKYFDAKSDPENPRWLMVDVQFVAAFPQYIPLDQLKEDKALDGLLVTRRGNRLSITPVEKKHFSKVCKLGGLKGIPS